jgi:DNA polymerase elongation subunit (family B)
MFFEDEPLKLGSGTRRAPVITSKIERPRFDPPYMSDAELMAIPPGSEWTFDIEIYKNYFSVTFYHVGTGKAVKFVRSPGECFNPDKLGWMLYRYVLIGFNSRNFDMPLLLMAMQGHAPPVLKEYAQKLIGDEMRPQEIERMFGLDSGRINHIDLIEVAPLEGSLKLYAARLHAERLQDLPIHHEAELTEADAETIIVYNYFDCANTALLFKELEPYIRLREALGREYRQDLRSRSDAQVAEAVIISELTKLTGKMPRRPRESELQRAFAYRVPAFVQFQTPALRAALATVAAASFELDGGGSPMMPAALGALRLPIGSSVYKLGMGGLHSQESCVAYHADENTLLIDRDVASYYPAIILNQQLFPVHLGDAFLMVYSGIVQKRLTAKKNKDKVTADALKITINGSFGKFGNQFSTLYSPDLMIQTTVTGQLSLLMLIEAIELAGIPVVSGNTDGIVIKCPKIRYDDLNAIIKQWETATNFETEETRYKAIFSRDVNNYIALKEDGTCKTKGVYSERGSALNSVLSKNPEALICSDAVQAYISSGTPISKTIMDCKDIRRFVVIRKVNGGGCKGGVYLGKIVRWYYGKSSPGVIQYVTNGNTVANSDGAVPLMDLSKEIPADLDFGRYLSIAQEMLYDLAVQVRPGSESLF